MTLYKQIPVRDLVGIDIAGKRAIVTQPAYRYQYTQGVPIVTLKRAYWAKEKGYNWLRLEWERSDAYSHCNFSGWREDHEGTPVVEFVEEGL